MKLHVRLNYLLTESDRILFWITLAHFDPWCGPSWQTPDLNSIPVVTDLTMYAYMMKNGTRAA